MPFLASLPQFTDSTGLFTPPLPLEFATSYAAQVRSLCTSLIAVYLPFFVFGRYSTRLDHSRSHSPLSDSVKSEALYRNRLLYDLGK
jgi:hypothetical protein